MWYIGKKVLYVKVYWEECLVLYDKGKYKGKINGESSIGCKVRFTYRTEDIEIKDGFIEIIDFIKQGKNESGKWDSKSRFVVRYQDNEPKEILLANLRNGNIGSIIGANKSTFKLDHNEYVRRLKEINPNIQVIGTFTCMDKRVRVQCSQCGRIWNPFAKDLIHHEEGCSECNENRQYPNKFARQAINQLKERYNITEIEYEFAPKWLIDPKTGGQRRFDLKFEYDSTCFIIEMDGGFHFKDTKFNNYSVQELKNIDYWKQSEAEKRGYVVIRVDCDYKTSRFKYIKKNFKQQLSPYFNLDSINWQLVHSYAITNLEKKAIKQYNSGDSEEEIVQNLLISSTTLERWLREARECGIGSYNNGYKRDSILAFKADNLNFIEEFKNMRAIEKKLGVNQSLVSRVCNNKYRGGIKGYYFIRTKDYLNYKLKGVHWESLSYLEKRIKSKNGICNSQVEEKTIGRQHKKIFVNVYESEQKLNDKPILVEEMVEKSKELLGYSISKAYIISLTNPKSDNYGKLFKKRFRFERVNVEEDIR